ncbi:MAG: hypothetical protein JWN34_4503 [Bryobacterales bacterium]|jgi:hypothetical protein|nr:hypothetical protein [Bryobacterales bacterium]
MAAFKFCGELTAIGLGMSIPSIFRKWTDPLPGVPQPDLFVRALALAHPTEGRVLVRGDERDEVGDGVASRPLNVDVARLHIQRRIQRQGSVAVILEAVALGAAR